MSLMSTGDSYAVLMERLQYPGSLRLRRILECLMTPEQAHLAAELPGTLEEVAQRTGVPVARVRQQLDDLYFRGIVFPRDFDNRDFFRFARDIRQFHDATQATQKLDTKKDRAFFEAWQDFVTHEWYPRLGKATVARGRPGMRVVPAYKAIQELSGILPCEDFREILKAQQLIAVVPCSCRLRATSIEQPCKHARETERWNCIQFGRGAEYAIKRGSGKEISLKEALDLMEKIEGDGLVHTWVNNANLTGFPLVCNCCRDCCQTYVPLDMLGASIGYAWEKSRYLAEVNPDKCNGCQVCLDRCQFDAIQLVRQTGSGEEKVRILADKCFGCGACVVGCAPGAIKMRAARPPQHIPGAVTA